MLFSNRSGKIEMKKSKEKKHGGPQELKAPKGRAMFIREC
jgi:hypothetical protein